MIRYISASREEDVIPAKVFVGNLSYDTPQHELESLFSEVGSVVEVFMPADRHTGRPRGFAFVEFADEAAVSEAIEKFNEYELRGRPLRVNAADERPSRPPRLSSDGGGFGGGRPSFGKKARPKGSRRNLRGKKRSL